MVKKKTYVQHHRIKEHQHGVKDIEKNLMPVKVASATLIDFHYAVYVPYQYQYAAGIEQDHDHLQLRIHDLRLDQAAIEHRFEDDKAYERRELQYDRGPDEVSTYLDL